jgi:hypothetical protein
VGVNQSIAFKMEADGKTGVAVILPASGGSGRTMKLTLKTPDSMKVTFTKKIADDKAFEPGVRYQFPITLYRPSPSASFDEIVAEGGFVGTAEIEDWEDVVVEPDEVSPDGTEVPDTPTRTLASIAISTQPTKTTYMVGESLSTTGMVVTATYSDNTAAAVTSYTTSGFNSSSAGQKTVTVSYTEGGVTKTTSFSVTINPATGSGTVDITTPGDALAAGLSFSPEQPTNGYSATFTVTAPASFDSYKWLIDGAVQIGTSNEFTITVSTLLSGSHSVTVIAEKNGKPYSATKTFKVR